MCTRIDPYCSYPESPEHGDAPDDCPLTIQENSAELCGKTNCKVGYLATYDFMACVAHNLTNGKWVQQNTSNTAMPVCNVVICDPIALPMNGYQVSVLSCRRSLSLRSLVANRHVHAGEVRSPGPNSWRHVAQHCLRYQHILLVRVHAWL